MDRSRSKLQIIKKTRILGACMRLLLGAKSMPFGCMSMDRLGAKYAVVGCKSMETFGCMHAVVGCKVCGDVEVQSMRLLGASFITAESLPDSR